MVLIISNSLFLVESSQGKEIAVDYDDRMNIPLSEREQIVPPTSNITIVTGQATPTVEGGIVAFTSDGRLLYQNSTYDSYFDVDPSPKGKRTVLYVASHLLSKNECNSDARCQLNVIERVNLSTGEVQRLHSIVYPRFSSIDRFRTVMIHDVDRINESHLIVADIARDQVYLINITSGIRTWTWRAQNDFPRSGGGTFPYDWTHINDVEYLNDGRIMVSLRNQDQVVFLDKRKGIISEWTLGEDDNHDVLFEQHNPDYFPSEEGGPAILVSDSENNRIVEYQRNNNEWKRSWVWQDAQLEWPRDADRLPNGNTIIADTHGNRIVEVDQNGDIVWEIYSKTAYDVERLGTGPESDSGQSATKLGLANVSIEPGDSSRENSPDRGIRSHFKALLPSKLVSAFFFVTPLWFHLEHLVSLLVLIGSLFGLLVSEIYFSRYTIVIDRPLRIRKK